MSQPQQQNSQAMDVTFTDSEPVYGPAPAPSIPSGFLMTGQDLNIIPMPQDANQSHLNNSSSSTNTTNTDDIYFYDERQQADIRMAKPWDREPNYFTHIKISVHALLKMLRHARKGGNCEIMGMLLGKVATSTLIVMDSFALPVEGTETRVNAHAQAYEYMADYCELSKKVDRKEHVIGWYHSHPGYGCWLSGIDCGTQTLNQQFQDPFVAIVIDPIRTISTGKVDIGAFRTYPKNFKPTDDLMPEYESIPMNKIEDFGVHCRKYYSLEISYFKSDLDNYLLDCLANKYWYNTLGTTSLTTKSEYTTRQLTDLSERLEQAEARLSKSVVGSSKWLLNEQTDKKQEETLSKVTGDCAKAVIEPITGLMALVVKDTIFNFNRNKQTNNNNNHLLPSTSRQSSSSIPDKPNI